MMKELLTLVLLVGGMFALVFQLASIATSMKSYPRYKPTYEALVTGRYRIDLESTAGITRFYDTTKENNQWSRFSEEYEILIFSTGSIKLIQERSMGFWGSEYIHSGPTVMRDLYSLYWYCKIHRWFKKNKQSLLNEEITWHKIKK